MTAGMAASRPIAVASSASAMPGATTARLVDFEPAMAWNEVMMPTTVPNRPMKGAAEPMVARKRAGAPRRSISRASATSIALSIRVCSAERRTGALLEALLPFAHGGDEYRAHAGGLAFRRVR